MKVTAFVGSEHKKHTYKATGLFMQNLQSSGEIEQDKVSLRDYYIEVCIGCKLYPDRGEELCLLKDDRDKLIKKWITQTELSFHSDK